MKMKKTVGIAFALAGAMAVGAAAANIQRITADLRPDIAVYVNGVQQTFRDTKGNPVSPIQYNGTTYLPVRAVANAAGMEVDWDSKTQSVYLEDDKSSASGTVGSSAKSNFEIKLKELDDKVTQQEKAVASFPKDGGRQKFNSLNSDLKAVDAEIDRLDDEMERAYKNGNLTLEEYRTLDSRVDALEDRIDAAEDTLERVSGYDD